MICINVMSDDIAYRLNRNRCNENNRKWLAANKERHNEQARQCSKRNPIKNYTSKKKYRVAHPELYRTCALRDYHANPEPALKRKRDQVHGAGATEHLLTQIQKQKNACAVCRKEFVRVPTPCHDRPCLDHNHETGQWRGALCHACNVGIGFFKENREALQRAIAYLKEWELVYEDSSDHPFEAKSGETP
jgi:hypothetical protein